MLSKIGVVPALLNYQLSGKALAHCVNISDVAHVIMDVDMASQWKASKKQVEGNPKVWAAFGEVKGYDSFDAAISEMRPDRPAKSERAGLIASGQAMKMFTSGTTGLPKAAKVTHVRAQNYLRGIGTGAKAKASDRMMMVLPMYHATGGLVGCGAMLTYGGAVVIIPKFSASKFWDDAVEHGATMFTYVGELCRYLLDQPALSDDANNPVRKMVGNGLRPNVWMPFKKRFGVEEIVELYAASDGNIGFTNIFNFDNTVGFSPMSWALVEYDKEKEEPVRGPDGFMRKVQKGGQGLLIAEINDKAPLDGYTDPEKTKKVVMTDVFEKGDRWFNTGDMLRDIGFGHTQFVDRLGDTFRWKGENVSTTEVENIVSGYPQISEAVVYGVEIPNTNGRAGMASITPAVPLEELDFKHLCGYLKENLPAYAVPLFLRIKEQMETTGTFKYQKSHLKEQAFDPSKTNGEAVYALLPGSDEYVEVNDEVLSGINNGDYRY